MMKTYEAKVTVTLKKSVLDPQGSTLKHALSSMGYDGVEDVRVGKFLELKVKESSADAAKTKCEEMCSKLLANPVVEEYLVEIVESGVSAHAE